MPSQVELLSRAAFPASVLVFRGLLCGCCLLAIGCGGAAGPATYQVTGTVTFQGEPVAEGQIALRDPEGIRPSAGGKIEKGKFAFRSQPGRMQVDITARRETGRFDESNPGEKTPLLEQFIPARYNTQTELEREIQAGKNEFAFELTAE